MKYKFKANGENQVLRLNDKLFVSYNPHPGLLNEDPEETAIVIEDSRSRLDNQYLIIQGDLRKDIEECKTLGEVLTLIVNGGFKINTEQSMTIKDFNQLLINDTSLLIEK